VNTSPASVPLSLAAFCIAIKSEYEALCIPARLEAELTTTAPLQFAFLIQRLLR
jgi:hypothetical protein